MIYKNEIICLKLLEKGPFFDEHLILFSFENVKSPKLSLRAMKKSLITLSSLDEKMVMYELEIRTNIRHPFLVNQVFAFQDYDYLYYITEYAPVQILRSDILPKKFSLEMVRFYAAEIFSCLRYLHSKRQNYTFLCPKNLLLGADGHIKLNYSFCNCLEYSMEELIENVEYSSYDYLKNKRFSYLSDYWSLGLVVYEMTMGYTPFAEPCLNKIICEMQKCEPEITDMVDPILKDFILLLLDKELETKYPKCSLLEKAIETHPFFSQIDFKRLEQKGYEPPIIIKIPEYDLKDSPKLDALYTTDFIGGDLTDGYGRIFSSYYTVNFLGAKRPKFKERFPQVS